ncbi:MAG: transporter [Blastocatellia bacterium]|nr:transporter [Blastocatellia bacterium]
MLKFFSVIIFLFFFLFILFNRPAEAQQRPLITEEVETVKPGEVRFELGFELLKDKNFPLSGLNGDLSRLGVIALTAGLASNVEFELGGVVQDYLRIRRQYQPSAITLQLSSPPNSTHDVGDFYLASKFKLRSESQHGPGFGFRFAVELPNSNQARGIGLNQTNFFATVLAGKHFGPSERFHVYTNLGLGILSAPVASFTQNDVLLYGLAAAYRLNRRFTLVTEINGRHSTRNVTPLGTESDGEARLGARIRVAHVIFDVAGIKGVYRDSASSGVTIGVSYQPVVFR